MHNWRTGRAWDLCGVAPRRGRLMSWMRALLAALLPPVKKGTGRRRDGRAGPAVWQTRCGVRSAFPSDPHHTLQRNLSDLDDTRRLCASPSCAESARQIRRFNTLAKKLALHFSAPRRGSGAQAHGRSPFGSARALGTMPSRSTSAAWASSGCARWCPKGGARR
jgi:hypothetical protein